MDPLSNLAFTTSGALIECVDSEFFFFCLFFFDLSLFFPLEWWYWLGFLLNWTEKVLVHLRDGRKLIGVLRSYDQYGLFFSSSLPISHRLISREMSTCIDYISLSTLFPIFYIIYSLHYPLNSYWID